MEKIKNQIAPIERITQGQNHNFFGYYDLNTWSQDGKYHLYHSVGFDDRLPEKEDVAQLGMINMDGNNFVHLAKTTAWNFQQGAMLQWNPGAPNSEVVYNIREPEGYKGIIKNIHSGKEKVLELPVINLDPKGRYGLSINFARMFDFRPGYGYAGNKDVFENSNTPEEDGVFRIDLATGKGQLILSLKQIWETLHKNGSPISNGKLLINHINFNPDGSRFVFLARNFPQEGRMWGTAVLTANADGSDLLLLSDHVYASHYYWKDPEHLLIYARHTLGDQLYVMKDQSTKVEVVDTGYFLSDGHCSYSPDKEWILYDSYPDKENYRHLYLYNVSKKKGITLASLYSYSVPVIDIRCDLHPRWNPAGNAISFDSNHENHRHIYLMDIGDVMKKYF